jgi:micrococcal nuclease
MPAARSLISALLIAACLLVGVDDFHPDNSNGDSPPELAVPDGDRLAAAITRDVDGDTVVARFEDGAEIDVRLIGVDTPEEFRPDTPVECGARAAASSMVQLAAGRRATLVTDPTQDRFDRYGRLLAYVYVRGRNIDRIQIRRGWAYTYVYDDNPFRKVSTFRQAEALARSESRGVWGRCGGDFHSAD